MHSTNWLTSPNRVPETVTQGLSDFAFTMPQAGQNVSEEHPSPDGPVADDMLLRLGSVHDDENDKADAALGDSDMHQDLLDIEADVTPSKVTSAEKHSSNESQQHPTRLLRNETPQTAFPSELEMLSSKIDKIASDFEKHQVKENETDSDNMQTNGKKRVDSQMGNGKGADNWSVVAGRSQGSNQ
jgi:TolA-binding protein